MPWSAALSLPTIIIYHCCHNVTRTITREHCDITLSSESFWRQTSKCPILRRHMVSDTDRFCPTWMSVQVDSQHGSLLSEGKKQDRCLPTASGDCPMDTSRQRVYWTLSVSQVLINCLPRCLRPCRQHVCTPDIIGRYVAVKRHVFLS